MSDRQQKMMKQIKEAIDEAKQRIADAQDLIESAAEVCRGTTMEYRLNSFYDQLEDMRFDMDKERREWEKQLLNRDRFPKSWKEAI